MTYKNISQFLEYNVDIQGGSKKLCILYDKGIQGLPSCFGNSLNIFSKAIQSLNCTEDINSKDCVSCNLKSSGECLYANQEVSCKYTRGSATMLDFFNSYADTKGLCEPCKKLHGNILSGNPCGYLNSNYTYFFPEKTAINTNLNTLDSSILLSTNKASSNNTIVSTSIPYNTENLSNVKSYKYTEPSNVYTKQIHKNTVDTKHVKSLNILHVLYLQCFYVFVLYIHY